MLPEPNTIRPRARRWALVALACLLGAPLAAGPVAVANDASRARPPAILVLGDSVSAGYGLESQQSWVNLLQAKLRTQGYGYRVINASVSGETTTGGLARLPRALELHRPKIVIIELGGNDGLRGLPLASSRGNLQKMIGLSRAADAQVLLLGMKIPPNYGPRYAEGFEQVFRELATRYKLAFEPFFLEQIALEPGMMQDDGLHPTAKAQPIMLETVWPVLQPLLKARAQSP